MLLIRQTLMPKTFTISEKKIEGSVKVSVFEYLIYLIETLTG